MKYYRYLYVDEQIKNVNKIKLKLNCHKGVVGYFVLYYSSQTRCIEIMNASYLKFNYYRKHPVIIIGIAKGYESAVDILLKIVNESLKITGKADLIHFLILKAKTRNFTIEA